MLLLLIHTMLYETDNCANKDFISVKLIMKAASVLHRKAGETTQYIMVWIQKRTFAS